MSPRTLVSTRLAKCCVLVAALNALACDDYPARTPTATGVTNIEEMVTPPVASILGTNGSFPNREAPNVAGRSIIGPETARALAVSYLQTFGRYSQARVEREHGGPVAFENLTSDQGVLLSESPYGEVPADASAPFANALGSYYLVKVRSGLDPVALVAVSAFATNIRIDSGRVTANGNYGNEFRTRILSKSGAGNVTSPEDVIRIAFETFGKRVSEEPRLVRAGVDYYPQVANWRVRFEAPVAGRDAAGNLLVRDVVYLMHDGTLAVPSTTQATTPIQYLTADGLRREWSPSMRVEFATSFHSILPAEQ